MIKGAIFWQLWAALDRLISLGILQSAASPSSLAGPAGVAPSALGVSGLSPASAETVVPLGRGWGTPATCRRSLGVVGGRERVQSGQAPILEGGPFKTTRFLLGCQPRLNTPSKKTCVVNECLLNISLSKIGNVIP